MILGVLKKKVGIEFYKFIGVGIIATLINYGVFYVLLEFLEINYLLSSMIGFVSGVLCGYGFNRRWTFKVRKKQKGVEIVKYYGVYIFSLILSICFLKIVVSFIGLNPLLANVLSIGLTTMTNFVGLKTIVFK